MARTDVPAGGDGNRLRSGERRGGGGLDRHRNELSGRRGAGEVHGGVASRPPAQQRRVGPARPLDEHLFDAADAACIPLVRDALDDLDEPLDPLVLDLLRNLIGHRGGLRPLSGGVDERERTLEADLLDDLDGLPKVALGLAREPDDDVGGQSEIRDGGA
jgi:hypothetical protein